MAQAGDPAQLVAQVVRSDRGRLMAALIARLRTTLTALQAAKALTGARIGVIGGLIVSTMLSLVFVPAVFTIMDDVGRVTWGLFSRFVGARDEEEKPAIAAARPAE